MRPISGVCHGGEVLRLFTLAEPEWGAAGVGRALGLSRSYAHRLLSTLHQIGLLERVETSGRFQLSRTWFSYTSVALASDQLITAAMPVLRRLWSSYGVRPMMAMWAKGKILSVQPTPEPAITFLDIRRCVTAGIVLMAGLPDDERAEIVSVGRGVRGFPSPGELDRCLRHVKDGGLLVRTDLQTPGFLWLAMPIMDRCGRVMAAISLHVPDEVFKGRSGLASELRRAATMLSNAVGCASGDNAQLEDALQTVDQ